MPRDGCWCESAIKVWQSSSAATARHSASEREETDRGWTGRYRNHYVRSEFLGNSGVLALVIVSVRNSLDVGYEVSIINDVKDSCAIDSGETRGGAADGKYPSSRLTLSDTVVSAAAAVERGSRT